MPTTFTLDMTMMFAVHDAFRRDLEHVATIATRSDGWELFKGFLHAHHVAEDDALWPVLRQELAHRPEHVALLDEMETEHAALGPVIEAIDDALQRGASALPARTELATLLEEHLTHEEERALPVVDAILDLEQWMRFGEASAARIGPDMPVFLPWLLDGADAKRTDAIIGQLPSPARRMYRNQWQPAYAAKNWWATPKPHSGPQQTRP